MSRREEWLASRQQLDPFAPVPVDTELERVRAASCEDAETETEIETEIGRAVCRLVDSCTVFLRGSECPFSCVFCDLWQHTLLGPTPQGALPHQLRVALEGVTTSGRKLPHTIKLYNASNYFEQRAAPASDDAAMLDLLTGSGRVVLECHPRLVRGPRCEHFAEHLVRRGSCLEVAMGLESTHSEVFSRLNKGCELEHFERAASWLREREIAVRLFLLCGLPWLPPSEADDAVLESIEQAAAWGVDAVTLIPLRATPELLEAARCEWREPSLLRFAALAEHAVRRFDVRYGGPLVVRCDLWDLDRLESCAQCGEVVRETLHAAELALSQEAFEQATRRALEGSCPGCVELRRGQIEDRPRAAAASAGGSR